MTIMETSVVANTLQIGDVILPPPRELRLWMNERLKKRGLNRSALYLTITNIGKRSDRGGEWLVITADESPEWSSQPTPWTFRVRPATKWKKVEA